MVEIFLLLARKVSIQEKIRKVFEKIDSFRESRSPSAEFLELVH
jgi:hypothetical protein